ncbi:NADPH:adrenodoxin oxidoreductase, mitochondrial [Geodia barretti]|uniref:NADPH:adrenodoxin oxidoreductase, mitochondrial n=1 Tax=Geodia barretti TaxID=519541 RepID=A0AA35TY03_GEOBA|nr:NADPH:adrenodoxin oxidoreductase, mitochondrial [Geodia barretti]
MLLTVACCRFASSTASSTGPLRVCVIGSGPAGFYTAHQLVKRIDDVHVDILDKFPVPFGLVRFGVAPDHPEIKNCINQFTVLARKEQCRFIGNVGLGQDVGLAQLRPHYHAVVLAYGAEEDKELGIPGEDTPGVYSARSFVGWYNGLPEHRQLDPDLSGEVGVVIGHGNVALDVARMLLTPVSRLKTTDMCTHAIEALARSRVKQVRLVGRRGPLQVAFTIKELREMTKLPHCSTLIDPSYFHSIKSLLSELPRPRRRITELMLSVAENRGDKRPAGGKEWGLSFLRSPVEIVSSPTTGRLDSLRLEINKLQGTWDSAKVVPTGEFEDMECDLAIRSIGYKTVRVGRDVPCDPVTGIVPNVAGRVLDRNKSYIRGLYCSGWVKTGPVGVILTTMNKAYETAEVIQEDFRSGTLPEPERGDILEKLNNELGVDTVSFSDWENIDRHEVREGEKKGKPREKIVDLTQMMDIVHKSR